ncbi:MAG: hypothetical protein AB8B88_03860 [Devosiaceae bacterium]
MRITHHGNDLLVTDQSLGLGAFVLTFGVLFLVAAASRLVGGDILSGGTLFYVVAGLLLLKWGADRLVATQLIVDVDKKMLVTKRWSFRGTNVQRIPFEAVDGFAIEPEGQDKKTSLVIQTSRGPVPASGGAKGVRAAWEEIIAAVETHMGRRPEPDHSS